MENYGLAVNEILNFGGAVSRPSYYPIMRELFAYFMGIDIDIERIIDELAEKEKKDKFYLKSGDCPHCTMIGIVLGFSTNLGEIIGAAELADRDVDNLEELAEYTHRAALLTYLYLIEGKGKGFKGFSDFVEDERRKLA